MHPIAQTSLEACCQEKSLWVMLKYNPELSAGTRALLRREMRLRQWRARALREPETFPLQTILDFPEPA